MALLNTWASQQDQATLSPLDRLLNNYIQKGDAPLAYLMRGDAQGLLKDLNTPKPVNMTQDMANAALNLNPVMGLIGATAFHGSPYLFEQFDPSKIGTGVGNKFYGKGTYFTESPELATSYASSKKLDTGDIFVGNKKIQPQSIEEELALQGVRGNAFYDAGKNPIDATINLFKTNQGTYTDEARNIKNKNALDYLVKLKEQNASFVPGGNVYKVDIPDEIIPNMLQWDKPLGEQTTEIQRLAFENAKPLVKEVKALQGNKLNKLPENSTIWNTLTGANLYNILKDKLKSEDKLTSLLQSKGIPGVKYTEERALRTNPQGVKYMDTTGEGSSNYVLFDPTVVKMLETKKGLLK
jgi:hypothetical protein